MLLGVQLHILLLKIFNSTPKCSSQIPAKMKLDKNELLNRGEI